MNWNIPLDEMLNIPLDYPIKFQDWMKPSAANFTLEFFVAGKMLSDQSDETIPKPLNGIQQRGW